jgi:hypothetical protein
MFGTNARPKLRHTSFGRLRGLPTRIELAKMPLLPRKLYIQTVSSKLPSSGDRSKPASAGHGVMRHLMRP